jgi:hypothetical protein
VENRLAIYVISCDNYRDVWKPFFELFDRFWPDCPYKKYLGTNNADFDHPGVTVVKAGPDTTWADNARKHLENIEEEYVLAFLEDFFLCEKVDSSEIAEAFSIVKRCDADLLSLRYPMLGALFNPDEPGVYEIDPNTEYCISTSIAIWKKSKLISLLKPGYSAWDFEVKNSSQANAERSMPGRFLSLDKNLFFILNGIWRRKWVPSTVRFCRSIGIKIDTSKRPRMSLSDGAWELLKKYGRSVFSTDTRANLKRVVSKIGFAHRFIS